MESGGRRQSRARALRRPADGRRPAARRAPRRVERAGAVVTGVRESVRQADMGGGKGAERADLRGRVGGTAAAWRATG